MKKSVLFVFVLTLILSTQAQQHFTNYASKNDITAIAEKGNQIWVGTTGGLSVRNKANGVIMFSYSSENGLPGNYITDILVNTLDNTVWVTTRGGLAKFDGANWTAYTTDDGLPRNCLQSITIDQTGQIWVYGDKYLTKLEANGSFTGYWFQDGNSHYYRTGGHIAADLSGNIWLGTRSDGAFKFNPNDETFTQYSGYFGYDDNVYDIILDAFGTLWFAAYGGLASYDGTNWNLYTTADGLVANFSRSLSIDNDGYIWVGNHFYGITKFDPTGANTQTYSLENLSGDFVHEITVDGNNKVWIGTEAALNRYTPTTDTWNTYIANNSISHSEVTDVKIDASNNIWVATFGGGLNRYNGSNWTSWLGSVGAEAYILCAQVDDNGNVWTGHNSSLSFLDVSTGIMSHVGLPGNEIVRDILCNSDGTLWLATTQGVLYFDDGNVTTYRASDGLADNYCNSLLKDTSGNLWIATEGGVSVWDGSNFTNYTTADGLSRERISKLFLDENNDIYATTHDDTYVQREVCVWNGSDWSEMDSEFEGSWEIDKDAYGNYWFVGNYGVKKYDGVNTVTYTVNDGLADAVVSSIAIDPSGAKWLGTEAGLSKAVCETPVPAFASDTACLPGLTHFSNSSDVVDACTKYEWDINSDASVDFTGFEPGYEFADEGIYSVKLTVSNEICSAEIVHEVVAYNTPVTDFMADTTCLPGLTNFSNTSTLVNDNTAYSWDINNDSTVDYTDFEPTHEFTQEGTYSVKLTAYNETCSAEIERDVVVYNTPVTDFTADTACLPGITNFSNISTLVDDNTTYRWDINNDGTVDYTDFEPTHEFTQEGTYSVKLTAYNAVCPAEIVHEVAAYKTPVLQINPNDIVSICEGTLVNISLYENSYAVDSVYSQGFESSDLASIAWVEGGEANTNWNIAVTNNAGGTAPELKMLYNPQFDGLGWIASPVLDASTYGHLTLNFNYKVNDYNGGYTIGVKTSSDGSNWHTVWSQFVNDDIEATSQAININNTDVGSNTFQFAFYFEGNTDHINYWYIDNVELTGATGTNLNPNYTYLWSNGETEHFTSVSDADTYSVTVSNNVCTYTPASVTVDFIEPMEVPICMVTVDHDLPQEKNLVVWEKPVTESIDHFNIYKEVTTDNYQLIGTKAYDEMSEFIDDDSQPAVHADKYKISVVDTCGNESRLSPYHQTMNLVQTISPNPNAIGLIWNKYIDESDNFIPLSYKVYRGPDIDNMTLETTLTGSLSLYTYNMLDVVANEKFMVVVDFPSACAPSGLLKANGGPYYQSISNLEDEGGIGTGIQSVDYSWGIYPNPVVDKAQVTSDNNFNNIRIFSIDGRLIKAYTELNAKTYQIDCTDLESGSYIIELDGVNKSVLLVQ